MRSLRVHSFVNMGLNLAAGLVALCGLSAHFFASGDYTFGLFSLFHPLQFEDVHGQVSASFSEFSSFACSGSQSASILQVCEALPSLQAAGRVYFLLVCVFLVGVLAACLDLVLGEAMEYRLETLMQGVHYVNCPVYLSAAAMYLLLCRENEDQTAQKGVFLMAVTAAFSIFTIAHYIYWRVLLRQFRLSSNPASQTSKSDYTRFSFEDLRRELEAKNEALARAQTTLAEQSAHLRATQDLGREITVLRTDNASLFRQLNSLLADTEAGLAGNEKALFTRLKEAERSRMTLERQVVELKFENKALKEGTDRSLRDLLDAKDRQLAELGQGETVEVREAGEKKAAGADQGQVEVEMADPAPQGAADIERLAAQNSQLSGSNKRLESTNQQLVDANAQLSLDLTTEQSHTRALKHQTATLQDQLQQALQRLGVQQDVDEVKGLLEESRRKELEDMRSLYEKRFNSLIEDQHVLRAQLDTAETDSKRKEAQLTESRRRKEEWEAQAASLESELKALKRHLEDAEQQRRDIASQHLRTDFDLKQRTTELEILREQLRGMEETHTKALAELTNSRGDQLEALKKLYEEGTKKDFEDRLAVYMARIEKLQGDIEAERVEKSRSEARNSTLEQELRTANKRANDLNSTVVSQSAQLEELVIKLAHIQTLLKQATDENSSLKRTVADQSDQLKTFEGAQDDLQRLNAKVLRDQEARYEKEVDRMREHYEVSHAKEIDDSKKFYEQKIGKIFGDLVNERQERLQAIDQADKLIRDKETLQAEVERLSRQIEKQKQTLEASETSSRDEVAALEVAKKAADEALARVRAELLATQAAHISPEVHQDLQERLAQVSASLKDREATIKALQHTVEELENGTNAPTALKEELHALREKTQRNQEEMEAMRQEIGSKDAEITRISVKIAQSDTEKGDLDQQLKSSLSQKAEIEKQAKLTREKLDRKRSKLVYSREQLRKSNLEREKELQELTESHKLDKEKAREHFTKGYQLEIEDLEARYKSRIASFSADLKIYQTESENQGEKVTEVTIEKNKVMKINRDLAEEMSDLKRILEDLSKKLADLKAKDANLQEENEDLKAIIERLKRARGEANSQIVQSLETQVADLSKLSKVRSEAAETAQRELEELRNEVRQKEGELQSVKEECMALHNELMDLKGRSYARSKSSTSMSREEKRSAMTPDSSQSVKEIMIIEGLSGPERDSNPILEKVSKLKKEAPMTYTNVWKFFENLMQEKCKLDRLEMSLGRQPRTMTEFMLDFVYLHYGLKTLALKQLQALVTSLQELYRAGHPYGVLFCRFIGVFHPRPLPHHLAVYLLVVSEEFTSLTERNRPRRSEKFAEQYDLLQYGGQASVIDIMELIVKICKGNREAGEHIIRDMLTDVESKIDLTLLKVCGTMARMGKDPKYMFEILDLDQGGAVDYQELVDGIRLKLNIWVTHEEAIDLCTYIDEAGIGQITLEDWSAKVSFGDFTEREAAVGMVSKANFLSALITEYEAEVVQDYYFLRRMINRSYMDQEKVEEFLLKVDPGLEEKDLVRYYEEILQHETDFRGGLSPEAACIIVLKYRIGGFGVGIFGTFHTDLDSLDQTLPKSPTEGVNLDLVVERDERGLPVVDLKRRTVS